MRDVPQAEMWGRTVYSDRVPVPRTDFRCASAESPNSIAHSCKLHQAHQGKHVCICGKTWTASTGAVAS